MNMAFTVMFAMQLFVLFQRSRPSQVEWLEILKLAGPIIFLNISLYFNDAIRDKIVFLGLFVLCGQAAYGVVTTLPEGLGGFVSDDGRFMIQSLGRGAGETAWALCVLIIILNYCVDIGHLRISGLLSLGVELLSLVIIVYSQSRGPIGFIAIYYFIYRTKLIFSILRNPFYLVPALVVLLSIMYVPSIQAMLSRSSTSDSFLTGREYIWAVHIDQLRRLSLGELFFGTDLEPKIVDIPEIGYVTADPHNIYIDIINYYGIFGIAAMAYVYKRNVYWKAARSKAIVFAFMGMGMLVSPFRYPEIFYANVLVLLIPTLRTVPYRPLLTAPNGAQLSQA
jgi:hypothetical protein